MRINMHFRRVSCFNPTYKIRDRTDHSPYKGDMLVHHHVDWGSYAIPVPASTHPGSGGPFHFGDNR